MECNAIKHDKYDKLVWNENKHKLSYCAQYLDENRIEDIFYLFFKYHVEVVKHDPIIDAIMNNRHYKNIKVITSLDESYSAIATSYFSEKFDKKKKEEKEDYDENMVNDISDIMEELGSYMEDISSSINTICGKGNGVKSYTNPKKKMELAEELLKNRRLNEFIEKLGKFKKMALRKQKTKIKHFNGEKHDIKYGSDLSKLLITEVKNLSDECLYVDFLKRFSEHKLLNYEILNHDDTKGDFIVCLDLSGSMRGAKEIWAKAIALSLLEIQLRDKKRFICILFDDDIREIRIFDKKPCSEEIIEFASVFFGGGTNFEKPIKKALTFNGDIVFITDGECDMHREFIMYVEEVKKGKIFTFCINTKPTVSLKRISDSVITIHQLTSRSAEELFDTII
ncbi:vWA domain-containing protein [Methanothermococcus thermolithotrophicus]|uniref:hypothetical protein n=1 Tax=Methanothermococcus thermolithotrophicus TaxID=2186 RepID=UPI0003827530|nr:hypothetical protein [Methanothermococcus thermolithotrophicus]